MATSPFIGTVDAEAEQHEAETHSEGAMSKGRRSALIVGVIVAILFAGLDRLGRR